MRPTPMAPAIFLASVIIPLYEPVARSPVAICPTSTVSGKMIQGIICAPPKPSPIRNATMGTRMGGVQLGSMTQSMMPAMM